LASYTLCTCGTCKRNNWKRYRVRWYNKQGKQQQKHFKTAEESKKFVAQIELELAQGISNKDIRFNDFAKDIPLTRGNQATNETMRMVYNKHISPFFGNMKIREIGRADVNEWLDSLRSQGYAPASLRKYLRLVNTVLEYAVVDRVIEVNPAKLVYVEGEKRLEEPNPLTPDELFDFIELWDNDPILKEHANYVTALAFTGMRPSECSALRWENVDLNKREIRVRQCFRRNADGSIYISDELKSDRAKRTLAIPEYLLGRLQFRKDTHPHEEFVFSSTLGEPIHLGNFRRRYWKKAILKAPFKIDVPYDLRHTFSAIMHSTGIDVWELSTMLGHANPTTTIQWYGNWFEKANHSAVSILDDWGKQGVTKFGTSS
jgi:integrase